MSINELADRIISLGFVRVNWGRYFIGDEFLCKADKPDAANRVVNDWRIAGACLKQWPTTINTEHLDCTLDEMLRDPHAIIEAYVEALS